MKEDIPSHLQIRTHLEDFQKMIQYDNYVFVLCIYNHESILFCSFGYLNQSAIWCHT